MNYCDQTREHLHHFDTFFLRSRRDDVVMLSKRVSFKNINKLFSCHR